jgi:hypothetical protein
MSKTFYALAQKRALCVVVIGFLGFAGSATIGLLVGIPEPGIHDEFSYLLAADTFAHGRLTNPTHPMWMHFESFHIIQRPTYMSKYPPAQGLILAAGQVISGYPILGVWLSMGLMCAAICWMLFAWVPPSWALLGGFLAVVHPELGVGGYWAQSYWGGAVPAAAAALVAGGLRRIVRRPHTRDALILGMGLVVLANSRPYEGLLYSLPAGGVLLLWMFSKNGPAFQASFRKIVMPILLVLSMAAVGMAYYNFRITGAALHMPYLVHEETYAIAPLLLWQTPRPKPTYRHPVMREFHHLMLEDYARRRSIMGFFSEKKIALRTDAGFYLGNAYVLPLLAMLPLMVPRIMRNRWLLFALLTCSVVVIGYLVETFEAKHYMAPITGLVFLFVLQGMRLWRWRDPLIGRFVIFLIVALSVYWILRAPGTGVKSGGPSGWGYQRARVVRQLERMHGNHLVIVSYGPKHNVHEEWVYNRADIDAAKIVWARDMGTVDNDRLLNYFKDRSAWLLNIDYEAPPSETQSYELISLR